MPSQTAFIIFSVIALTGLCACVGQFETKLFWRLPVRSTGKGKQGLRRMTFLLQPIPRGFMCWYGIFMIVFFPALSFRVAGIRRKKWHVLEIWFRSLIWMLAQEAFVRPEQLARYTGYAWANHPLFSEGGGGDWWPLRAACDICLSPGLLMLAQEQPESVYAEPYEAFAGWNTAFNKADDFFSKGFQLVQFPTFWVLNSHMDLG